MAARRGTTPGGQALSLQVLDGFRVTCDGRLVSLPLGGQRVLGLLALRRRVQRETAAAVLWPEHPQERASASLRTALWRISSALPHGLHSSRSELALDDGVQVDVDLLLEAAEHVRAGDEGWSLSGPPVPDGELLPGWDEQWLLLERERLRQVQLFTLVDVARAMGAAGRTAAAVDTAYRALRLEPLRESTYRLLVELHAAAGDVAEALRQVAVCERLLSQELGVGLSPMMLRLRDRLRPSTVRSSSAGLVSAR